MKTIAENGSLTKDLRFVYYNYLQIAQEDQLQVGSEKQRVWDPSGALLMVRQNNTSYFTCFDGNKNISDYVDSNGTVVAHYEYSPFGQITSATGSLKDDFEYRFSSEYSDSESGFVYYNFRYYSPKLGRWLSKDPVEEKGGLNLYVFVGNDGIGTWDLFGLCITGSCTTPANTHSSSDSAPDLKVRESCCGGKEYDPSKECCVNKEIRDFKPQYEASEGGLEECIKYNSNTETIVDYYTLIAAGIIHYTGPATGRHGQFAQGVIVFYGRGLLQKVGRTAAKKRCLKKVCPHYKGEE